MGKISDKDSINEERVLETISQYNLPGIWPDSRRHILHLLWEGVVF